MVLEIPGDLFGQRDVRETATRLHGTFYLSLTGSDFIPIVYVNEIYYDQASKGECKNVVAATIYNAPVHLPHGAVITAITVWGSISDETYTLLRNDFAAGAADTLASANLNTEDTSISNAPVDNSAYHYWIRTSTLDGDDTIYGARITYTI